MRLFIMLFALLVAIPCHAATTAFQILGGYTATQTVFNASAASVSAIPDPAVYGPLPVTMWNSTIYSGVTTRDANYEVMSITAKLSTTTFRVVRGTPAKYLSPTSPWVMKLVYNSATRPTLTPTATATNTYTPTVTSTPTFTTTFTPTSTLPVYLPDLQVNVAEYLKKSRVAYAKMRHGDGQFNIAIVGDSIAAGTYAPVTDTVAGAASLCWPSQLAQILTSHGITCTTNSVFGNHLWGTYADMLAYDPRFSFDSTYWTAGEQVVIGGYAYKCSTSGHSVTFSPTGNVTTFDVTMIQYDNGGHYSVRVDSDTPVTFSSQGLSGYCTGSVTVASGTHTVYVERVDGTVYLASIRANLYGSKSASIWNFGASGATCQTFGSAAPTAWSATAGITFLAPDLTIYMLGANDINSDISTDDYSIATQRVIDAAALSGDVVLLTNIPNNAGKDVNRYRPVIFNLCYSNNIAWIDTYKRMSPYNSALYPDNWHPNKYGAFDIAEQVAEFILSGLQ